MPCLVELQLVSLQSICKTKLINTFCGELIEVFAKFNPIIVINRGQEVKSVANKRMCLVCQRIVEFIDLMKATAGRTMATVVSSILGNDNNER